MIRVLLVDDSPLALHILQTLLERAADIRVVGTALNGRQALPLVASLRPDVICIDLHMPVMDGLAFTREVMASDPRPVLVVSISVRPGQPGVFALLEAGAVDVLPKRAARLDADDGEFSAALIEKVRIVAGVRVFQRPRAVAATASPLRTPPAHPSLKLVVIGASTGGPQAIREVLAALPADFALPLVCVQHIGREFLAEMLAWLSAVTPLAICRASGGELPVAGRVYFAPEDAHLEFDAGRRLLLSHAPPLDGHRPSVTVTMESAARQFGAAVAGVLLTGMGRDGAAGMLSISRAGGVTIAQDAASSVIYGMPSAAVSLGAAQQVLPLAQIAPTLMLMAASAYGAARRMT